MNCNFCERRCELSESKYGFCRMYCLKNGSVAERFPGRWSAYLISRAEAVPFYHAYPGSRCLTIGTMGCNFNCSYCANAFIAKEEPEKIAELMHEFSPAELVRTAKRRECDNIIFNVNEPTVSLPSLVQLKKAADLEGLPLGCLTNAYTTKEGTKIMAEIFAFMNISLKGLSAGFNRQYLGIPNAEPVLRNIRYLAKTIHLEITTPIIQDVNDFEIDEMARFIAGINPEIPWHVFRLLPEYKMKDAVYPNIDSINEALEKSRELLKYVYFHNFVGSDWVNTVCPACGRTVIERFSLGCGGDKLKKYHCPDNVCPDCGRAINIHGQRIRHGRKEATA